MKSFKKMLKIVFGQATPFQLFLGCLFGFILGFIPGFSYAPFLVLLFIFLVLIFNVNIGFVVIAYIISKILSFIIEGLSFHVGQWLLDGALAPIFKWMINTPVLAYAGFDYYLVTGGFIVAIILGIIVGLIVVKLFTSVRNKMASVQTNSEMYQKIVNKFSVKLITWILLGKAAHKVDWVKLKDKRLKHPFRISGVVLVVILIILLFVFQSFLQGQMVSNIIKSQLTKVNGATVDFKTLDINLTDAKLSITGLGFANPDDLANDRFYAEDLTAKLNISHLLTKRLSLAQVVINTISFNHQRTSKGVLYVSTDSSVDADDKKAQAKPVEKSHDVEMKSYPIDQYIKNAKQYKGYLDDVNRLLNMISSDETQEDKKAETESVDQQVKVYGYANVRAVNLVEKVPTLTIESLTTNNIKSNYENKVFNLNAKNLATEPYLLDQPTTINLVSTDESIKVKLFNANQKGKVNTVNLVLNKLPAKALFDTIKFNKNFSLTADKYSLNTNGQWHIANHRVYLNLPVDLDLYKANLKINNTSKALDSLKLKFKVTGSLDNPSLEIDQDQIKNILLQAGTSEIKDKINNQLKDKMPSFGF
ncbi:TIGR03546 family protein [Thiotrichales bacterium 19S3-7]|nr:TIGR03546 family protein [Thiotrichales bacterium 19S3-7]MCF6801327.1 TIGR03546 family protein [Thiotrichales bacterium 19S3-11]